MSVDVLSEGMVRLGGWRRILGGDLEHEELEEEEVDVQEDCEEDEVSMLDEEVCLLLLEVVVVVVVVFSNGDLRLVLEGFEFVVAGIFMGIGAVSVVVLDGSLALIGLKEVVLFCCCCISWCGGTTRENAEDL